MCRIFIVLLARNSWLRFICRDRVHTSCVRCQNDAVICYRYRTFVLNAELQPVPVICSVTQPVRIHSRERRSAVYHDSSGGNIGRALWIRCLRVDVECIPVVYADCSVCASLLPLDVVIAILGSQFRFRQSLRRNKIFCSIGRACRTHGKLSTVILRQIDRFTAIRFVRSPASFVLSALCDGYFRTLGRLVKPKCAILPNWIRYMEETVLPMIYFVRMLHICKHCCASFRQTDPNGRRALIAKLIAVNQFSLTVYDRHAMLLVHQNIAYFSYISGIVFHGNGMDPLHGTVCRNLISTVGIQYFHTVKLHRLDARSYFSG